MKKVSTVGTQQSRNISQQRLTIGLDLGDRSRNRNCSSSCLNRSCGSAWKWDWCEVKSCRSMAALWRRTRPRKVGFPGSNWRKRRRSIMPCVSI